MNKLVLVLIALFAIVFTGGAAIIPIVVILVAAAAIKLLLS